MAKTTGKRPVPSVAKGKGNSWNTSSGSYSGARNTKTPTGKRPVPSVAHNHAPGPPAMKATKSGIKHTSMPHSRRDQTTGASKATGGGGRGY